MKILIATKNPGKIEGAKGAFKLFYSDFEIESLPMPSCVPEQPVNEEIYFGAKNRVKNLKEYAKKNNISADYYISIESGINNFFNSWAITNVAIIEDNTGYQSVGISPSLPVPDNLAQEIIRTDFSQVMNNVFTKDDERHNYGGGIQLLTHGNISRIDITKTAFIMALTKFVNGEKWK